MVSTSIDTKEGATYRFYETERGVLVLDITAQYYAQTGVGYGLACTDLEREDAAGIANALLEFLGIDQRVIVEKTVTETFTLA